MRASLRDDLKTALKTKDRVAIAALRSALAAIDNAEAVPCDSASQAPVTATNEHVAGTAAGPGAAEVERRHLTDDDQRDIVAHEVRGRTISADEYDRLGRGDTAERLRAEAAVLQRALDQDRK
ncbi:GatB/YqeY domain-containing protein [Lentzea sp.]|uniref:GatB/YqeY domain-containing protein n=1 Tax=Lentzea sp. TaxID=56099 RepID=UPI002B73E4AF|nr:GatB/YqeY domain-containing protein [Lentzea sp.]HUQ54713.1 GatB/YqeY domain-containing protein [Lentzea sp.]